MLEPSLLLNCPRSRPHSSTRLLPSARRYGKLIKDYNGSSPFYYGFDLMLRIARVVILTNVANSGNLVATDASFIEAFGVLGDQSFALIRVPFVSKLEGFRVLGN